MFDRESVKETTTKTHSETLSRTQSLLHIASTECLFTPKSPGKFKQLMPLCLLYRKFPTALVAFISVTRWRKQVFLRVCVYVLFVSLSSVLPLLPFSSWQLARDVGYSSSHVNLFIVNITWNFTEFINRLWDCNHGISFRPFMGKQAFQTHQYFVKLKQRKSQPWRRFGKPILINVDFGNVTSSFTPQFLFRLRRYIKHERQCFIGYPNISKICYHLWFNY